MKIDFLHRQSAHCESGVTSNLLSHYGINISEATAFGIGAGLFFAYLPFIRINKLPLTTFRINVGGIFKRVTKALGIEVKWQKFKQPEKAMDSLDQKLEEGIPVGCQTGGYWLPYFPDALRFHFNAHNLVVIGKEGDNYLISDPVFPETIICDRKNLMKARFAKGALAPKGNMYYLNRVPDCQDLSSAVIKGIRAVCKNMLKPPLPLVGVRGIRFLANRVEIWPQKLGKDTASLYLGQIIRMQEEIGTGGAGFRFIYAAFLQEAAVILSESRINAVSEELTETGDRWREFAASAARNCKGRASEEDSYPAMANMLRDCANREKTIYQELQGLV
ncbi:MAG: BtrH N-terminal domain-containing protein [Desulfobacterales bacterium]